mmetsp:Transcript_22859/g.53482  ORF Transcript_22859/g.53482 Transcript_22859/m.53482 type:complete len:206 (+) Transcript_22859:1021-1638(+)
MHVGMTGAAAPPLTAVAAPGCTLRRTAAAPPASAAWPSASPATCQAEQRQRVVEALEVGGLPAVAVPLVELVAQHLPQPQAEEDQVWLAAGQGLLNLMALLTALLRRRQPASPAAAPPGLVVRPRLQLGPTSKPSAGGDFLSSPLHQILSLALPALKVRLLFLLPLEVGCLLQPCPLVGQLLQPRLSPRRQGRHPTKVNRGFAAP